METTPGLTRAYKSIKVESEKPELTTGAVELELPACGSAATVGAGTAVGTEVGWEEPKGLSKVMLGPKEQAIMANAKVKITINGASRFIDPSIFQIARAAWELAGAVVIL